MINSYYIIYYTVIIVKSLIIFFFFFEKKNLAFTNKNQPKSAASILLSCDGTSFIHTTKLLTYLACLARL